MHIFAFVSDQYGSAGHWWTSRLNAFFSYINCVPWEQNFSLLFFTVQLLLCCFSFFSFSSSQTYSPTHSSLSTPWENYPLMPLNDIHIAKSNGSFSVFILLHCSASLNVVDYSVLPERIFLAATMTPYYLFSFFLSSYFLLQVPPLLFTIKYWHFYQ